MTKPITIYTFDGTASAGARIPSNPGTLVPSNIGGGYAAELADKLVKADPQTWEWVPVDYVPNRALGPDWRPVSRNVLDSYNGGTVASTANYTDRLTVGGPLVPVANRVIPSIKQAILDTPGKFVLSGLSQGTIAVGYFLNELRFGQLRSRFGDLIGVYNFGDPFRPARWTVPLQGATDPGGAGALNIGWQQSYGTSKGLHVPGQTPALSSELYWSFCNNNDAAAAVLASAQPLIGLVAHRVMYNTPESPNRMVLLYGKNGVVNGGDLSGLIPSGQNLVQVLSGLATSLVAALNIRTWLEIGEKAAKAAGTWAGPSILRLVADQVVGARTSFKDRRGGGSLSSPSLQVSGVGAVLTMLHQWWPFAVGFLGLDDYTLNSLNPHAKYSKPFAYTAMKYNDQGAVQLAFNRLHALGKTYYPHATAAVPPATAKPYWLLTFGKPGQYFDPATSAQAWPQLTALGTGSGSGGSIGPTGSDFYGDPAVCVTADFTRRDTDPQQTGPGAQIFTGLSAATKAKVEWVPVSYSSAAFPSALAARAAVDRAVRLILASPVGTKFFIAGHGLGAIVSTLLWDEFQSGRLVARKSMLRGIYNYGNPVRASGLYQSEVNPGGEGLAVGQTGVRLKPATVNRATVWEFAMPTDLVAVQPASRLPGSPRGLLRAAFNVAWQNAPTAGRLQFLIGSQARTDFAFVNSEHAKQVVLSLYSDAAVPHNWYNTFIARPKSNPGKNAIQLAIDNINTKAV